MLLKTGVTVTQEAFELCVAKLYLQGQTLETAYLGITNEPVETTNHFIQPKKL